jgi:hypothetical protein
MYLSQVQFCEAYLLYKEYEETNIAQQALLRYTRAVYPDTVNRSIKKCYLSFSLCDAKTTDGGDIEGVSGTIEIPVHQMLNLLTSRKNELVQQLLEYGVKV